MEEIEHWVAKVMHKERGGGTYILLTKTVQKITNAYNLQCNKSSLKIFEYQSVRQLNTTKYNCVLTGFSVGET